MNVEVVPINLEPHPLADFLSIIKIKGYTVVGKTEDWKNRTKAVYIPPDSLVPLDRPEFSWLADLKRSNYDENSYKLPKITEKRKYHRVTVMRLRKILSYGLLIPCSNPAWLVGQNVENELEIKRYNVPEDLTRSGETAKGPSGIYTVKYDIESFEWYANEVFKENELVHVSEKCHGSSSKFVFKDGKIHVGSRTEWKKDASESVFWQALKTHPEIQEWLKKNPEFVLYGEVYGMNKGMHYDRSKNRPGILLFDVMKDGKFLNLDEAKELTKGLKWCPELCRIPYNFEILKGLAEGPSLVEGANHFREGIVVRKLKEDYNEKSGRCLLKIISESYFKLH